MKTNLLTITIAVCTLVLSNTMASAQGHDAYWILGYNSLGDPGDSIWGGVDVDFNTSPLETRYVYRPADMALTNASISDEEGHLQFYCNGCRLYNREHEVMMNGDSLNPGNVFDYNCGENGHMGLQSVVIIPSETNDSIYHVFHKSERFRYEADTIDPDGLPFGVIDRFYYTKVNMNGDNGLGRVVEKNIPLYQSDSLMTGELVAVRHSNGEDWWLLVANKIMSDEKTLFLLNADGTIEGPFKQHIGDTIDRNANATAHAVMNPSGTIYAYANAYDGLWLYDFDRSSGTLSSFRKLDIPADTGSSYWSPAFSSNGRFLYISDLIKIWQFDMHAADIQASRREVADMTGMVIDNWPAHFGRMQRGPDCRIYIAGGYGVNYLHVIRFPNRKGTACQVEIAGLELPAKNAYSIPYFPNYRLGEAPVCDSSILFTGHEQLSPATPTNALSIFPNPVRYKIQIQLSDQFDGRKLNLYDIEGALLEKMNFQTSLNIDQYPPGMYILEVITQKGHRLTQKVFIQ